MLHLNHLNSLDTKSQKVSFQPVYTGRGDHLPLKQIGQTQLCAVWGSLYLIQNKPVTFPALPVPVYTPGSRGVITDKCLTQGHNTLAVTGLEPTTFCLWTQHWSARSNTPTRYSQGQIQEFSMGKGGANIFKTKNGGVWACTHNQMPSLQIKGAHAWVTPLNPPSD